ncbi:MAG: LPP20 family lipoprotein [Bacteroidia bacterium]
MKNWSRFVTIILLFLVFVGKLFSQQTPNWVLQQPIDNNNFIGIASANKNNPDYVNIAKNRAMEMLASEISIKLVSQTLLNTTEVKNKIKQQFVKSIQTETVRELEGFEIVEIWQDKKSYWIYYKLSKETYYLKKKVKVLQGIERANFYIIEAEKSLQNNDAFQYINQYFLAAYQVQNFTSFEFDAGLRNQCNQIYSDCYSKLSKGLTSIAIQSNSFQNGLLEPLNKELIFNTSITVNEKKIRLANVHFKFNINAGSMNEQNVISDNEGNLSNKVNNILPKETNFSVRITSNFKETFATFAKQNNLLALTLCENITTSSAFSFTKKQVLVFIQTNEQSFSKTQSPKLIEAYIKELILKQGLFLTKEKIESQFIIKVASNTNNLGESFELKVVGNNTEIEVLETKLNKLIYSKQLLNVKGLKKDLSAANIDSYNKVIYKIKEEVQQEIWQSMGLTFLQNEE